MAQTLENTLNLKKNDKTLDSKFSISPEEMEELITKSKETWLTLGKEKKIKEKIYSNLRRSIYVTRTINDGEKISKENIKIIRPGFGLEPKYFNQLIGKRVKKN